MNTENIKTLLGFGFQVGHKIKEITSEDSPGGKKVVITEILGSIGLLTKIPGLIRAAKPAYEEWLDLDEAEKTDLKDYFREQFDLTNDKIEAAVEAAWEIVLAIGALISILEGDE